MLILWFASCLSFFVDNSTYDSSAFKFRGKGGKLCLHLKNRITNKCLHMKEKSEKDESFYPPIKSKS